MGVVVFSGSNDRAILAFCRFATQRKVSFGIVANGNSDIIFETGYANHVFAIREKNKLNVNEIIGFCDELKERLSTNSILILPSTEYLNRFLLVNREEFSRHGIEIGLCEKHIYELVSDKYSFGRLCANNGFDIPMEYLSQEHKYPFIIKPKKYADGHQGVFEKPALIFSEEEFESYMKVKKFDDYYFQEFIGGKSYYLLYFISKKGDFVVYSQENLIQQDDGGSMILCRSSSIHKSDIAEAYARLFLKEGFSGLVMVEIKFYNDRFYMIEANPRLWGPSQLILDAGMDLFDLFALENKLIDTASENEYKEHIWYYWSGGLCQDSIGRKTPAFHNYSPENFIEDYGHFIKNDIYLNEDSLNVYLKQG